ncbi:2-hydroxyacid dehydrogenase [Pararhizobium antarcticum]|uniref:Hydroxyacid dehydrogenase n=1 Tax=Pararhizobium antarcticum TaxID=1798805 RepID=A0A657LLI3_9HYPH|nr:2-hydroxyacid dehydrogenase [Pararhizobium antarcticum]OJF91330.1 hydroxyacid dehydrogenase [Pararhizobium antarcticum]OJG01237.1 hydroxyacid dehydrogenase [Rhizobium sp. 58]
MTKPEIAMVGAYPAWDMEAIDAAYTAHRLWEAPDRDVLIDSIAINVRAIATRGELGASAELMRRFPKLELVSCYGVGTDAIDLSYARAHGIKVTNTPDVLTDDVADLAIALMLATARQIPQADRFVRDGSWAKGGMPLLTRVCGKKVGIAGMGRIGQAIARRAGGFDCEIAYTSRSKKADIAHRYFDSAAGLADWADFLIVIVSGGEGTKDLIDAKVLSALGPDGILINVSRGTTVDETALLEALEKGQIRGAGLDVFRNEPTIDPRFATLQNVVLHPHHGSGTVETRQAMGRLVRDNLAAHFAGADLLTPVA